MTSAEKVRELMRLHDEAFDAAMRIDGHCKSSEGYVEICLTNHTDRAAGVDPMEVQSVGVYSYVLGPSRMHHFDSVDEALEAVRGWHRETFEWITRDYPETLEARSRCCGIRYEHGAFSQSSPCHDCPDRKHKVAHSAPVASDTPEGKC